MWTTNLLVAMLLWCPASVNVREMLGQDKATEPSAKTGQVHSQTPASIFREVRPVLLRETHVPLRLPTFLPYLDDALPVYVNIRSADQFGYVLDLEYQKDCLGAYACTYARFRGSSMPITVEKGDINIPVMLYGRINGYFVANECGANCGEPIVEWSEDGFYYVIAMKAEDKDTLVKVANSAI